ncbi:AEC family transporter [Coraliomargarita sp. SDUM461004]|uniref:AEC family transporter n=1 Tax=Thalassobacterium sedimentorum TaxID=3041258 RepID=A0ABU1AMI5_9BACT|nr:AEC family transporter [Coraliomargarita sp. SDUM461004]MDQ8195423.1 AEC family transporter [Coraliomargarita sp. SDUM461004]
MIQVINTLLPVFVVIGLGLWLARRGWLSQTFISELNWLIFWVSLPALIIHSLVTAESLPRDALPAIGIFTLATLILIALAWLTSRWLQLPRERVGTFVQSAFRGNLAFAGLPFVVFAVEGIQPDKVGAAVAQVMFLLAPAMLLYNVLAVLMLTLSQQSVSTSMLRGTLGKVISNPLILASIIGVGLFALPFEMPRFALSTLGLIGQMAAPASLFCVGGAMAFVSMEGRYRSASYASALKVIVLPAITALLLIWVDVDPIARLVLLILSACPTAVASYIMAKALNGDEALAAGSIILSTLACIPTVGLIIALSV